MHPGPLLTLILAAAVINNVTVVGTAWERHTIDASSRGADGTRLADVNGDGFMDIATGWEEGGRVRVYLNPGPLRAKEPWPAVTVGAVNTPEDAVFADLDSDGAVDVVSCTEGNTRMVYVHWAPANRDGYLDPNAWRTEPLPASEGARQWMFCLPMQVDGKNGVDLVVGSKNRNAAVGWFEAPDDARDMDGWQWHPMTKAGWIMSLVSIDMDADGDHDILYSDRVGSTRGCYWLENSGSMGPNMSIWEAHRIGGHGGEVMFLCPVPSKSGGVARVYAAVRGASLLSFARMPDTPDVWRQTTIAMPDNVGTGKSVAVGDVNLDRTLDLVVSCENAENKHGVFWLSSHGTEEDVVWHAHAISDTPGTKFDLVVLYDFDADGDLDVLTCEERENLGVIWYENPTR